MTLLVISLNIVGWPLIQLTLARLFLRLPDALFAADSWLTIERGFERDGQLYRRFLMMQRWKRLLPEERPARRPCKEECRKPKRFRPDHLRNRDPARRDRALVHALLHSGLLYLESALGPASS